MRNQRIRFLSKKLFIYILSVFVGYNLFAQDVDAGFMYTVSGGCDSVEVSFTDTSLHSPSSWQWNFSDGTSSSEQNPTKVFTGEGSYSVTFIISNGESADTVEMNDFVTVYASPEEPITSGDLVFCDPSDIEIQMQDIGSVIYKWYESEDAESPISSEPILRPAVEPSYPVTYWVSQTINGCESSRTSLTVDVGDVSNAIIQASPGFDVCEGDEVNLNVSASDISSASWSGDAVSYFNDAQTSVSPTFSGDFPGIYTISVDFTDYNGCTGTASETITVHETPPLPNVAPSPRTIVILPGDPDIILEVEPSVSDNIISWFSEDGMLLLENSAVYDTGIDGSTPTGFYNFVVKEGYETSGGICYSEPATITLDVSRCPARTPEGNDFYYCVGSSEPVTASVSAASTSTGSKISWFTYDPRWQSGAGIADLVDDNLTYTSSLTTENAGSEVVYAAEYDLTNDCWSDGLPVSINIVDNPEVEIIPQNIEIALNKTISINAIPTTEGGTGVWSGTGVDEVTETSAIFTPQSEGTVPASYIYTSSEGCESEEQFFDIWVTPAEMLIQQDSLSVTTVAGELEMVLLDYDLSSITKLTVSGEIHALDIYFMRDSLPNLTVIDISQVTIEAFEGDVEEEVLKVLMSFDAHSLPPNAFKGKETLQEIRLPQSIRAISDGAFEHCSALSFLVLNTENPESIEVSAEAFTGVSTENCAVIVPEGSKNNYATAEVWKDFLIIGESIEEITGINDAQHSISVVQFEDELIINGISSEATVSFINIEGKKVMSLEIFGVSLISTSKLSHGFYTLQIISDEGVYNKKLFLQ